MNRKIVDTKAKEGMAFGTRQLFQKSACRPLPLVPQHPLLLLRTHQSISACRLVAVGLLSFRKIWQMKSRVTVSSRKGLKSLLNYRWKRAALQLASTRRTIRVGQNMRIGSRPANLARGVVYSRRFGFPSVRGLRAGRLRSERRCPETKSRTLSSGTIATSAAPAARAACTASCVPTIGCFRIG